MATLSDLGVSAAINILSAFAFFVAFAILRLQPFNDRVYFPKWYLKGVRGSPIHSRAFGHKFLNLDYKSYLRFLNWMPAALIMPEPELIDHAGLDSAVYLRIYLIGLKIFIPITFLAFTILFPVNWTNDTLERSNLIFSDIDKLSISNIPLRSQRFWTHIVMAYVFTFWTCYVLRKEYEIIASMRLHFLASEQRRPDQFTIALERDTLMPAAFVSFKTRWGAAVCSQTQQSRNPTLWLTEWAAEPRDVYWDNLAIPFVSLTVRRLIIAVSFFFLTFFFMIPIAFVQSLANIEGIEKAAPFLKPIIEVKFIKSFIQGFLPGIALKIFLIFLPTILMLMSKVEGFISISALERRSASRYYIFQLVNVFLGSIIAGTAFQQLDNFIHQSANEIPRTIGESIPMKATFFITYIMVDGWAGIAGEILRLKPLIIYHLKNFLIVKTEKDREEAMDPGSLGFDTGEPQIQLYFLLGLVYAVVTPFLLPFILVFFGLAYVVFRHQVINVYNQDYESGAAFWPDVHGRIIAALIISQLLLMGLLSTKNAAESTPFLLALPVLTISFHRFCKSRFEPAFIRYPLQEAMMKDTLERAKETNLNLKEYLQNSYIHPVFKGEDNDEGDNITEEWEQESKLVPTKRQSRRNTPLPSKFSGSSSPPSLP